MSDWISKVLRTMGLCATKTIVAAIMTVFVTGAIGQETPPAAPADAPPSAEDARRMEWLRDWNDHWLNYDPTEPVPGGLPTDAPEAAGSDAPGNGVGPLSTDGVVRIVGSDGRVESELAELAADLAAQDADDAPGTIHRKIWANPLDDPSNQKAIFFCVACTILIVVGVRLILRKRAMNRTARSAADRKKRPR